MGDDDGDVEERMESIMQMANKTHLFTSTQLGSIERLQTTIQRWPLQHLDYQILLLLLLISSLLCFHRTFSVRPKIRFSFSIQCFRIRISLCWYILEPLFCLSFFRFGCPLVKGMPVVFTPATPSYAGDAVLVNFIIDRLAINLNVRNSFCTWWGVRGRALMCVCVCVCGENDGDRKKTTPSDYCRDVLSVIIFISYFSGARARTHADSASLKRISGTWRCTEFPSAAAVVVVVSFIVSLLVGRLFKCAHWMAHYKLKAAAHVTNRAMWKTKTCSLYVRTKAREKKKPSTRSGGQRVLFFTISCRWLGAPTSSSSSPSLSSSCEWHYLLFYRYSIIIIFLHKQMCARSFTLFCIIAHDKT